MSNTTTPPAAAVAPGNSPAESAARKTVGSFFIEDGALSGPAEYMREQGNEKLDGILAGNDVAFNLCCHMSPDIETAILVAMQTNYAGWLGAKQLINSLTRTTADAATR